MTDGAMALCFTPFDTTYNELNSTSSNHLLFHCKLDLAFAGLKNVYTR
jgi:hypothetical protein